MKTPMGYAGTHRAEGLPSFRPDGYLPRHCSGVTPSGGDCLHQHADERKCACGQTLVSQAVPIVNMAIEPLTPRAVVKGVRHTAKGCHAISPASRALMKAGA